MLEIFYVLIGEENGIIKATLYAIFLISYIFILFFLAIEYYGILTNLTYNEIICGFRYKYFYKTVQDKRGNWSKLYRNLEDRGIKHNVKEYIKNSLNNI